MNPATKKRKLELIQDQLQSLVDDSEERFLAKDRALAAAMAFACNGAFDLPHKWSKMPEALRNDSTALVQVLLSERKHFIAQQRSEIPAQVLQEALQKLLESNRPEALQLYVDGLFTWEEVSPTENEWRQSESLSIGALRNGLVHDLAAIQAEEDFLRHAVAELDKLDPQLAWPESPW